MQPRKTGTDHHHSDDEIEGYLVKAIRLIEQRKLTREEGAAVLPTLVNLYAAKQVFYEQVQPAPILDGILRRG